MRFCPLDPWFLGRCSHVGGQQSAPRGGGPGICPSCWRAVRAPGEQCAGLQTCPTAPQLVFLQPRGHSPFLGRERAQLCPSGESWPFAIYCYINSRCLWLEPDGNDAVTHWVSGLAVTNTLLIQHHSAHGSLCWETQLCCYVPWSARPCSRRGRSPQTALASGSSNQPGLPWGAAWRGSAAQVHTGESPRPPGHPVGCPHRPRSLRHSQDSSWNTEKGTKQDPQARSGGPRVLSRTLCKPQEGHLPGMSELVSRGYAVSLHRPWDHWPCTRCDRPPCVDPGVAGCL